MKSFKLLIIFLICTSLNAQVFERPAIEENITVIITQDVKLATMKDDHGNTPFTADIRVTALLKGFQTHYGNLEIRLGYEYADLQPIKYIRYSGGVGYSFNHMILPNTDYKYHLAPFVNYGVITREGNGTTLGAFEIGFDLKFPLTKHFKIVSTMQWTDRNDINKRFNTFDALSKNFNWGVGLECLIL